MIASIRVLTLVLDPQPLHKRRELIPLPPQRGLQLQGKPNPSSKIVGQKNDEKKKGSGTRKGDEPKSGGGKAKGPEVNSAAGNGSKRGGPKKDGAQGGSSQGEQKPQSQRQPPHKEQSAISSSRSEVSRELQDE